MDVWRHLTQDAANAQAVDYDDSNWSLVNLPHSYNAAGQSDGGDYRGIAWYRKLIEIPEELAGKLLYLQFDGVSFTADIFIDGEQVGPQHRGGFSRFDYEVTKYLSPGRHLVAVKVDNSKSLEAQMPPQAGDYTKSGGIYRDVQLIAVSPVHIALQEFLTDTNHLIAAEGVYCTATNVSASSAELAVKTKLDNQSALPRTIDVVSSVINGDGSICWHQSTACTLAAGQLESSVDQSGVIEHPRLWNGRIDPFVYDVFVELRDHETQALIDLAHIRTGIRSFVVDPQRGFMLNGEHYDLHGASAHQDELGKSWARSAADIRNDIDLMLEMGATIVRTSHYPASQAFYDYADQTGLIVYTELPNNGTTSGGKVPSGDEFLNSARDQMRELIRQNYNHPSIVTWGLFNEISGSPAALTLVNNLQSLTKDEERALGNLGTVQEPLRRTTVASWTGVYGPLESITDTFGLNKYYGWYDRTLASVGVPRDFDGIHAAHPSVAVGVSEYGAGANVNQHDALESSAAESTAENPSRSQWHPEERQTWNHEQWWPELASRDYLWYKLIWQMFDSASVGRHEGDQQGINDKGLVTADRKTRKDAYFFYKANWNDPQRSWAHESTLYIAERRWTERPTKSIQVKVYSNLGTPTLSINGVSLGEMSSTGCATYVMNINLASGENNVEVAATHNGQRITDSVVWHCRPDLAETRPAPASANVSPRRTIENPQ